MTWGVCKEGKLRGEELWCPTSRKVLMWGILFSSMRSRRAFSWLLQYSPYTEKLSFCKKTRKTQVQGFMPQTLYQTLLTSAHTTHLLKGENVMIHSRNWGEAFRWCSRNNLRSLNHTSDWSDSRRFSRAFVPGCSFLRAFRKGEYISRPHGRRRRLSCARCSEVSTPVNHALNSQKAACGFVVIKPISLIVHLHTQSIPIS